MALKVKIPRNRSRRRGWRAYLSDPVVKAAVAAFIICCTLALGVFAFFYIKYERMVDARMRGQIFSNTAKIYAKPRVVRVGYKTTAAEIARSLRGAGYSEEGGDSTMGTYKLSADGIEVRPGPDSYHNVEPAKIYVEGGKVKQIVPLDSEEGPVTAYELEPELVTALFDSQERSKRQLISYDHMPKHLVDAVLAIEDRRFFQHSGVNFLRLAQVAWMEVRHGDRRQGGSTITMQLSRGFFLTPEKTYKRKLTEILIAFQLEQRFTKREIFELYANQIYMGQRGSFTINGFGEASRSYFNKDIKDVNLPESALLAAIIQRPSYLNPYKNPERALARRNLVLEGMVETGAIGREEADKAKATPLKLAPPNVEASDAPYFVDLVKDQLLQQYSEEDLNGNAYRIYTTLDADLQRAAADAVAQGIKEIDAQVEKMRTRKVKVGTGKNAKYETKIMPGPEPQVALVAIDPKTGAVLALVGGRNYGQSQLNHAVAKRPTGSIFKPFVYAAAVNAALEGAEHGGLTPASLVDDSPGTFIYGDEIYEPRNYKEEYHGLVSARRALALSLNNATVRIAEQAGYDRVAEMARAAGITSVKATPAAALGAYDATPLEMAGAYTVFANNGVRIDPIMVKSVRNAKGEVIDDFETSRKPVLDPRVAYVMTDMMEAVVNVGTAAGVRARGFAAPAAGKTGTSHDGWFAGYTTNLICIVWVGYDDYSDLRLSGSATAAPIWAEFMKKAVALPQYSSPRDFPQPPGVIQVHIDKATNLLATASCPDSYVASFIAGTEPTQTCDQQFVGERNLFQRILGIESRPLPPIPVSNSAQGQTGQPPGSTQPGQVAGAPAAKKQPEKKKGFFGKIFGIFSEDEKKEEQQKQQAPQPTATPAPAPR